MAENWSFIVGFGVPILWAALLKANWSKGTKAWVALLLCVAASLVTTWIADPGIFNISDGVQVFANVIRLAVASIIFYEGVWKPLGTTAEVSKRSPIT